MERAQHGVWEPSKMIPTIGLGTRHGGVGTSSRLKATASMQKWVGNITVHSSTNSWSTYKVLFHTYYVAFYESLHPHVCL